METTERSTTTGKRRKRSTFNWVAVSSIAALLSAIAGMVTAGAGIWRPPVPIPAIKVTIVGPTAVPTQVAQTPVSVSTSTSTSPGPSQTSTAAGYSADWSKGMDGWTGAAEWKNVPGMLVSDGSTAGRSYYATDATDTAQPPYKPSSANYAVEARAQVVSQPQGCFFGIRLRASVTSQNGQSEGYFLGLNEDSTTTIAFFSPGRNFNSLKSARFSPGTDWHLYRAEVKDNQLSLFIDDQQVLQTIDNQDLNVGQVGLGSGNCQVQVSSFKVTPL